MKKQDYDNDWLGSLVKNARNKLDSLLEPKGPPKMLKHELYSSFVSKLSHPQNKLVFDAMKVFVHTFASPSKDDVSKYPDIVKDFCVSLRSRMYSLEIWQPFAAVEMSAGLGDALTECIEKWVTTELFSVLFCRNPSDIEHDKVLFDRLSSLAFLTPQHLEIPRKYWAQSVWATAAEELFKITKFKSPLEKLEVITRACQMVLDALMSCEGAGADVFLPVMVFVLLLSNPPQLWSSVRFIRDFRNKSSNGTQMEYFLVSLETSISFVEKMQSSDLHGITQEEMDSLMAKCLAGEKIPSRTSSSSSDDWVMMGTAAAAAPQAPPIGGISLICSNAIRGSDILSLLRGSGLGRGRLFLNAFDESVVHASGEIIASARSGGIQLIFVAGIALEDTIAVPITDEEAHGDILQKVEKLLVRN